MPMPRPGSEQQRFGIHARLLTLLLRCLAALLALDSWNDYRAQRDLVQASAPDDLRPLEAGGVPFEVVPLVDAVNHHMARYQQMLAEQALFLADASHQLRTPLAIMWTQAGYALPEPDATRMPA